MATYTIGKDGKVKATYKKTEKKPIELFPITKKIKKWLAGNGKAKATEGVVKSRKSPGPTQRKKLSKVSGKAKATAKRAAIREKARNPNKKKS